MNGSERDDEKDVELASWLGRWTAPPVPERLGGRLQDSYRARRARRRWGGFFEARLTLRAPLAALIAIALLVTGLFLGRRFSATERPDRDDSLARGLADLRPLPEVRVTVEKGEASR
jgi:hypothetical protein